LSGTDGSRYAGGYDRLAEQYVRCFGVPGSVRVALDGRIVKDLVRADFRVWPRPRLLVSGGGTGDLHQRHDPLPAVEARHQPPHLPHQPRARPLHGGQHLLQGAAPRQPH
jgi:hypothetical protein